MKRVEDQLVKMRNEFHRVCKERGRAHFSAKVIQLQEKEIEDFQRRRHRLVDLRAQEVAHKAAKKVVVQNELKREEKLKTLQMRKKLLKTDWTAPPPESSQYWQELQNLSRLEEALVREMQGKRKKTVSCQVTLSSSSSSTDSACCQIDSESLDECCINEIALRVLNRLKSFRDSHTTNENRKPNQPETKRTAGMQSSSQQPKKKAFETNVKNIYRDAAINTSGVSGHQLVHHHLQAEESVSSQTSYRSLANDIGLNRDIHDALNQMSKDLLKGRTACKSTTQPKDIRSESGSSVQLISNEDNSGFWKRVFSQAGLPLNESTMMLVKDLEGEDDLEETFSALSITSKTLLQNSPTKHSTPITSCQTSPTK